MSLALYQRNNPSSKMKKIIETAFATALFMFLFGGVNAQSKTDSTTYQFRKNEIGINLAPVLSYLMGGAPNSPRYSVSYKHLTKGGNAIRFGAGIQVIGDYYGSYFSIPSYDNYQIISYSSTTEVRRYSRYFQSPRYQGNVGFEWRRGKKRLSRFFGADLCIGYYRASMEQRDHFYSLDSTGMSNGNPLVMWKEDVPGSAGSLALSSNTPFFTAGISPFYGIRYPISRRFVLSAQMGVDFFFGLGKNVTDDYANGLHSENTWYQFNFDSPGIINDVSLVYRF